MGTEAIQGIAIDLMKVNDMSVDENVFCNLQNLRLLQLNHVKLGGGYDTAIRQVPSTIVKLKNLEDLSLCGCKGSTSTTLASHLRSWFLPPSPTNLLPLSFHGLDRLTTLSLRDCNLSDDALPRDLGSLRSLTNLELGRNSFRSLPASLSNLLRLTSLKLDDNERIETIPDLPRNLDVLQASNCTSLERLPDISLASRMRLLYIANCPKLIEAPGLDKSKSISHIDMQGCYNISNTLKNIIHKGCFPGLVLPGNEIPALFNYKNEGATISFKLPEFDGRILSGINVCIVCSSHLEKKETKRIRINLTNHTKGFTNTFQTVAINLVKSCEDHLWQGHLSNKVFKLGSEDEVELIVFCGNTMIVKKTGVYLVFEQDEAS
ncbi:hypothetical protein DKX38_028829 [Salix brachista]|uniref:C-JID domain-containing protein n=1 Tax=Salix brachista TaxID=2182728 RepID=A0A5N5IY24_9ROSI|nr:hypothetical protein DKX38_028829 [Salix brachista]